MIETKKNHLSLQHFFLFYCKIIKNEYMITYYKLIRHKMYPIIQDKSQQQYQQQLTRTSRFVVSIRAHVLSSYQLSTCIMFLLHVSILLLSSLSLNNGTNSVQAYNVSPLITTNAIYLIQQAHSIVDTKNCNNNVQEISRQRRRIASSSSTLYLAATTKKSQGSIGGGGGKSSSTKKSKIRSSSKRAFKTKIKTITTPTPTSSKRWNIGADTSNTDSSKKQKRPRQPTKEDREKDENDDEFDTNKSMISKKETKSKAISPPWQVLGSKDAIDNIQREKERRSLIQQGIVSTNYQTTTTSNNNKDNKEKISKNFLHSIERKYLNWKRFNPSSTIGIQKLIGSYLNHPVGSSSNSENGKEGTTTKLSPLSTMPSSLGVPEIAFLGRSNVGKSSLLNKLAKISTSSSTSISSSNSNKKQSSSFDLARVGKTPGATASVNMYCLYDNKYQNKELIGFIDLPGFGYAKLSKTIQSTVQGTAEQYLNTRKQLALAILLVDIRRYTTTSSSKDSTTKDKENNNDDEYNIIQALYDMDIPLIVVATKIDKIKSINEREQCLYNIQQQLQIQQLPFYISSTTGENIKDLWQIILDSCETSIQYANKQYESTSANSNKSTSTSSSIDDDDDDDDDEEAEWYNNDGNDDDDDDIDYDQQYDWSEDNDDETDQQQQGLDWDNDISNYDDTNDNDTYDNQDTSNNKNLIGTGTAIPKKQKQTTSLNNKKNDNKSSSFESSSLKTKKKKLKIKIKGKKSLSK